MTATVAEHMDDAMKRAPDDAQILPRRPRVGVEVAAIAAVLVVATVLRLIELDRLGLNSDEAVYAGQAAALAGDESRGELFSLFRAHPVLFQMLLSVQYRIVGVDDTEARVLVAAFAVATVALTWVVARGAFDRRIALVAAALVAVLPYHVLVSRQVLLDTPMAFFALAATAVTHLAITRGSRRLLLAAAVLAAAAVLVKEVAILLIPGIALAVVISRRAGSLPMRSVVRAALVVALAVAPFPLSRLLRASNAGHTLWWQLTRPANHPPDYFGRVLLEYAGPAMLALVVVGGIRLARRRDLGAMLVVVPATVFAVFFVLWPTKLLPYLMVIVPALAMTAAVGVIAILDATRSRGRLVVVTALLLAFALPASLAWSSWRVVTERDPEAATIVDAGVSVAMFEGGRELGDWAAASTPEGSRFLTVGPSVGNIVAFYSGRGFVAISVSPDPARRNPAYVPVRNPDLALRNIALDYAVWDAYSARRSPFSGDRLLRYVRKFNGVPVFSVFVDDGEIRTRRGPAPDGVDVRMLVFNLQGGDPTGISEEPEVP